MLWLLVFFIRYIEPTSRVKQIPDKLSPTCDLHWCIYIFMRHSLSNSGTSMTMFGESQWISIICLNAKIIWCILSHMMRKTWLSLGYLWGCLITLDDSGGLPIFELPLFYLYAQPGMLSVTAPLLNPSLSLSVWVCLSVSSVSLSLSLYLSIPRSFTQCWNHNQTACKNNRATDLYINMCERTLTSDSYKSQ